MFLCKPFRLRVKRSRSSQSEVSSGLDPMRGLRPFHSHHGDHLDIQWLGRSFIRWIIIGLLVLSAVVGPALGAADPSPDSRKEAGCAVKPEFVTLDGEPVMEIRRAPGAQAIEDYVKLAEKSLLRYAKDWAFPYQQLTVKDQPPFATEIGYTTKAGQFQPIAEISEQVAICFDLSRKQLATQYKDNIVNAIDRYRSVHSRSGWIRGTVLAVGVLAFYILWIRIQNRLNDVIGKILEKRDFTLLNYLNRIGVGHVIEQDQIRNALQIIRRTFHWFLLIVISYLSIPLILGFFPPTHAIGTGLREQVQSILTAFSSGLIRAIPGLLSIAIISSLAIFTIRISNSFFRAIEHGRLSIPGFYQEWAQPTARLTTLLIGLIGLAAAFPYIPGSDSKIFQGAGVLVGILAALGSSAIATNIVSGLMLIYTRAFRVGDLVDINGVTGTVQDRALLVTRLQTSRNELVSIPNATVIAASVVNFSFSRREIRKPVALATTITIGYDVPWRQVHELMLAASRCVDGISTEIEPYVLQTALNDFHISYELNVFVNDTSFYRQILSNILASLQDQFAKAGIEILSPGYHAIRNGDASTIPPVS